MSSWLCGGLVGLAGAIGGAGVVRGADAAAGDDEVVVGGHAADGFDDLGFVVGYDFDPLEGDAE
jgi:hypothetical protein